MIALSVPADVPRSHAERTSARASSGASGSVIPGRTVASSWDEGSIDTRARDALCTERETPQRILDALLAEPACPTGYAEDFRAAMEIFHRNE